MATLNANWPTLLDVVRRSDNAGKIMPIVEILNQTNLILDDIPWIEGNLPTGHKTTIRTGLPAPTWRKLYGGVQPTKSTTVQVTDTCGMLEAYAEVDKKLADLNGNTTEFRLSEDRPFIEGMGQEFASTLFYGNETSEPEAFTGFSPRYADISDAQGNVLYSGTTKDTSIWLIGWGENTIHGIYPKGMTAGLNSTDKGQVTIENATEYSGGAVGGGRFEAYRTHYSWDVGLTVRDWRYAARIQVDISEVLASLASGPDLVDLMTQATELLPSLSNCNPVFYMNRQTLTLLRQQIVTKAKYNLGQTEVAGKKVSTFDGIPVRRCDALLGTETAVSA